MLMLFTKIRDLLDLSLQIVTVLEEVAFMITVEAVPHFTALLLRLLVFLIWQEGVILLDLLSGLFDHFGC